MQILRAVAATMVVALHASLQAQPFSASAWSFHLGNAGVDIFFPISGFVMVVSTAGRTAGAGSATRFALARVLRIAPIYYLLSLAKIGLTLARPQWAPGTVVGVGQVLACLLFVPLFGGDGGLIYPPIKPGWTLNLEMFYYALIVLVLLGSRRIALYVPLLIGAVVIAGRLLGPRFPLLGAEGGWGDPMALEFAAGMLLGQLALSVNWVGRWKWPALAAGLAIYAFGAEAPRVIAWGLPGMLFLWFALGAESKVGRLPALAPLLLLGDASYSIYLTHALTQPAISALIGRPLAALAGPWALMAVLILAPLALAVVFHLIVERPLTRILKTWLQPKRPRGAELAKA